MPHLCKFLIAVMSLTSAQHAFSDSLYQFSSVNQTFTDDPVTLGFVFEVNSPFEITSLGWFSPTAEGFQTNHTVGLYDSTGSLLTSADLAAGSTNPLTGFFRYQAILPLTLDAGRPYVLAGTSGGSLDSWTVNNLVLDFSVNPAVTIAPDAARFAYGTGLVNPTSHYSDYLVYAGPNLEGHEVVSATPEPSSVTFVLIAGTVLFSIRKVSIASKWA